MGTAQLTWSCTYDLTDLVLDVVILRDAAAEELAPQQVPVVLEERQVEVAEKLDVLVLHL